MTKDLGVWTAQDCAQVLIDYQNEKFEAIRSETPANVVELHVRLLAKTAKAHGMPIVLSLVGMKFGSNGPTLPPVLPELDGIEPLDRSSTNAFEDYWHFSEIPRLTDAVGVQEAEKSAASAHGAH